MALIIGIVGEKLVGKDTVADYLVHKYGAAHVRTSHILDELLETLGLPITRRNEIDAGRGMEMVFGPTIIGEAMLRRVQAVHSDIVVINGLRQVYQFEDAKKLGAKILYVTAPPEVRYKRMTERREKAEDTEQTYEEFLEQDKEWIEAAIPNLGARADYKIENTGSREELQKKVDEIIQKLK